MRILRLELRKTNICPYCIAAAAIFLCLLGLSFLFAYVPKLESGRQRCHCAYGLLRAVLRYGIPVCDSGILRCSGHLTVQLSHQPKTYPDGKNAAVDDVYIHSGNRHDAV